METGPQRDTFFACLSHHAKIVQFKKDVDEVYQSFMDGLLTDREFCIKVASLLSNCLNGNS